MKVMAMQRQTNLHSRRAEMKAVKWNSKEQHPHIIVLWKRFELPSSPFKLQARLLTAILVRHCIVISILKIIKHVFSPLSFQNPRRK
jgi:hypothetical protein